MAEKVIVDLTGRTQVCIESAFGTAGSWEDVYPAAPYKVTREREAIPVSEERANPFDHQRSEQGLLSWTAKVPFAIRAAAAPLNKDATPALPPNLKLLKATWGAVASDAGSLIVGGSTTAIEVTAGQGSRFSVGGIYAVIIGGVPVPFQATAIDGDDIDVWPTLPGAPSVGAVVLNGYNAHPTSSNVQSLGLQYAKINHADLSDYAQQWCHLGGTGDASLTLERGKAAMLAYELRGKPWTGPSSAPRLLPAPEAADTQGAEFIQRNVTSLWQPIATLTRTHCPLRKVSFKFNGAMKHEPELGGVENCSGVARVPETYCFAEGEITKRYDPTFDAYYDAKTDLALWHVTTIGSGATAKLLVVHVPRMFLGQKPDNPADGGDVVQTHAWQAMRDTRCTGTGSTTDLATAPFRIAIIG